MRQKQGLTYDSEMDELYREQIIEHYKHPRHWGGLEDSLSASVSNPMCGDEMEVFVRVHEGVVIEARFQGRGCAISQAGASLALEEIQGMPVSEVLALDHGWQSENLGVDVSPARIKCADLILTALRQALATEQKESIDTD